MDREIQGGMSPMSKGHSMDYNVAPTKAPLGMTPDSHKIQILGKETKVDTATKYAFAKAKTFKSTSISPIQSRGTIAVNGQNFVLDEKVIASDYLPSNVADKLNQLITIRDGIKNDLRQAKTTEKENKDLNAHIEEQIAQDLEVDLVKIKETSRERRAVEVKEPSTDLRDLNARITNIKEAPEDLQNLLNDIEDTIENFKDFFKSGISKMEYVDKTLSSYNQEAANMYISLMKERMKEMLVVYESRDILSASDRTAANNSMKQIDDKLKALTPELEVADLLRNLDALISKNEGSLFTGLKDKADRLQTVLKEHRNELNSKVLDNAKLQNLEKEADSLKEFIRLSLTTPLDFLQGMKVNLKYPDFFKSFDLNTVERQLGNLSKEVDENGKPTERALQCKAIIAECKNLEPQKATYEDLENKIAKNKLALSEMKIVQAKRNLNKTDKSLQKQLQEELKTNEEKLKAIQPQIKSSQRYLLQLFDTVEGQTAKEVEEAWQQVATASAQGKPTSKLVMEAKVLEKMLPEELLAKEQKLLAKEQKELQIIMASQAGGLTGVWNKIKMYFLDIKTRAPEEIARAQERAVTLVSLQAFKLMQQGLGVISDQAKQAKESLEFFGHSFVSNIDYRSGIGLVDETRIAIEQNAIKESLNSLLGELQKLTVHPQKGLPLPQGLVELETPWEQKFYVRGEDAKKAREILTQMKSERDMLDLVLSRDVAEYIKYERAGAFKLANITKSLRDMVNWSPQRTQIMANLDVNIANVFKEFAKANLGRGETPEGKLNTLMKKETALEKEVSSLKTSWNIIKYKIKQYQLRTLKQEIAQLNSLVKTENIIQNQKDWGVDAVYKNKALFNRMNEWGKQSQAGENFSFIRNVKELSPSDENFFTKLDDLLKEIYSPIKEDDGPSLMGNSGVLINVSSNDTREIEGLVNNPKRESMSKDEIVTTLNRILQNMLSHENYWDGLVVAFRAAQKK